MIRRRLDGDKQFQMMCEMYGEPERGGVDDFGSHRLIICRARPVRAKIRHHVAEGRFTLHVTHKRHRCLNRKSTCSSRVFNRCNPNPNPGWEDDG
jgi:hypothetical protein